MTAADVSSLSSSAPRRAHLPGEAGMWFFIIGDLLIFAVYFVAFMLYRNQDVATFATGQQALSQSIGVGNTLVLLSSSLMVALAVEAGREQKIATALRLLAVGMALGALFPLLKAVEWIPKISAGHTPGESLFFMFYYLMTGLHLLHVLIGLCLLGFMYRELKESIKPNIAFIEAGAMYWHMVDVLWLVLLAVFYLLK